MSPSCPYEKWIYYVQEFNYVPIPTYKCLHQNDYTGANFTMTNDNRNIPLEKLISIDMYADHSIKLNVGRVHS